MAYQRVEAQFNTANQYATAASASADAFIAQLNEVVGALVLPNMDADVAWPDPPALDALAAITIEAPNSQFPADDTGAIPDVPNTTIVEVAPPSLPTFETFTYAPGVPPTRPADISAPPDRAMPAALNAWTAPAPPAFLAINNRVFGGVDTHDNWLAGLQLPDDLALVQPAAFEAPELQRYQSWLLDDVTGKIRARLLGGTGIDATVESEIWDRARSREAAVAATNIAEVLRNAETSGFSLPSGSMHAQLREAQKTFHAKSSELSRDIAIKQAELEQANAKHAIEQGIALESQLIQYVNNIEQRTFDAAKYLAQQAVEVYNSMVGQYRANMEKYGTFVSTYRALIDGEIAKVSAYRAEIEAESTKATLNQAQVGLYQAQIEARSTLVEQYRNEVSAVSALIGADKVKIEAYAERIKAYVAEVNAESARAEVFKIQNQSNQTIAETYRISVDAYATAQKVASDLAKTRADTYETEVRSYAAKAQVYGTRVSAEAEKLRALTGIGQMQTEVAKAQSGQSVAYAQLQTEHFRAMISMYESNKSLAIQKSKVFADNYFALQNLVAEASKVAAQVNAQMAASAYGTIQANASVSGSDSTNSNFIYSGATSDSRGAPYYT